MMKRLLLTLLTLAACLTLTMVVAAAEPGVMVRPFTGARSQKLTEESVKALEAAGFRVVPADAEGAASLSGVPEDYVEVARKHDIKAYVECNVTMSKRGWVMDLQVRNAKDGSVSAEPKLKAPWLPGLIKKVENELAELLSEPLSQTELPEPAVEEPEPDEADADEEAEEEQDEEPDSGERPSPLDVDLGVGLMYRTTSYTDSVSDAFNHALHPSNVGPLTLRVGAHWYPVAHFSNSFLAHIGLAVGYYRSLGGATELNDASGGSQSFDTVFSELNLGGRVRLELGSLELGLNGSWGTAELTIEGDNEVPPGLVGVPGALGDPGVVPDASYTYIRLGPDAKFALGDVDVALGIYYRLVTLGSDEGQWAEARWFPNAEAKAIEAQLSGLFPLSESLSLFVGADYRQYALTMNSGTDVVGVNPTTNQPQFTQAVAGGASDMYVGGFAGVQFGIPATEANGSAAPEPNVDEEESPASASLEVGAGEADFESAE